MLKFSNKTHIKEVIILKKESQLSKNIALVTKELIQIIKDAKTDQQIKINACETLIHVSIQYDKNVKQDDKFSCLDSLM